MGVLLIGSVLVGCQATLSEKIITENNMDNFLEIANGKGKREESTAKILDLGIPKTYQTSFQNKSGDVVVNVNGNVIIPKEEFMSIYTVEDDVITQEMLNKFIDVMTKGADIYSIPSSPTHIADVEEKLEVFRKAKEAGETYLEGSEIPLDEMIKNSEESLEYLKANLTEQKIDSTMQVAYGKNSYNGRTTLDGDAYTICYRNADSGEELSFVAEAIDTIIPFENVIPPDYEISSERMEQMEWLIEELGYENMTCVHQDYVQTNNCPEGKSNAYRFVYMRSYDGVDSVFVNGIDSGDGYIYETPVHDEYVEIILTEDKIVEISCICPQHVVGTEVEQAVLLSFEEVCDVFQKMMLVKYPTNEGSIQEFTVDKIQLGYKKIRVSVDEEYMMVPIWDFNGMIIRSSNESVNEFENKIPYMSHLTINAIDGTIISDRVVF